MPDPKPNTVAHCNQRIDDLIQYEQQLEHRIESTEKQIEALKQTSGATWGSSGGTAVTTVGAWSAPRTSSEDAQKKAVESARQTTRSVILAAIREEINGKDYSTQRVRNLSDAFMALYERN